MVTPMNRDRFDFWRSVAYVLIWRFTTVSRVGGRSVNDGYLWILREMSSWSSKRVFFSLEMLALE